MAKLIEKRWVSRTKPSDLQSEFSKKLGISPIVAQVVLNRGITDIDEARKFLFPDYAHLLSPYLMNDMAEAVARILEAVMKGQKITIYGDYDVDGVSSTTTMMLYLSSVHPNIDYYIPHRSEGYGLNKPALKSIKDSGTDLVISVDCGITAIEEVEYCKEIGLDIIITDHHEAPEVLPAAIAVVNPKRRDNTYPYTGLAGVGVAYKLCVALQKELKSPSFSEDVRELLDVVALGTVADIMPLTGENRVIVKKGLELMSDKENVRRGFKALIKVAGIEKDITAGHIGFQLGPRINALGRLYDVKPAVRMFLTEDDNEAQEIAQELNRANEERQAIQEGILKDVLSRLPDPTEFKDNVIVLGDENWHTGIKGIVASNVLEKYYRPVALFSIHGEKAEGSARSIEDFDLKGALDQCAPLLVKYGGHHSAAGMTTKTEDLEAFKEMLNNVAGSMLSEEDFIPKVRYDSQLAVKEITFEAIEQLSFLEPFGQANPSPLFMIDNATVLEANTVGKEAKHLKLKVQQGGHIIEIVGFGYGELKDDLMKKDIYVDIIGTLDINEFRGKSSIQIMLKDIKIHQKHRDPEYVRLDDIFKNANDFLQASKIGESEYFYTKIVGVSFEGRQELLKGLEIGEVLDLQRQPENQHDKNAIAILKKDGTQLGFLKAKLAKDLARYMDNGWEYSCTVTEVTGLDNDGNNLGVNIIVERQTSLPDQLEGDVEIVDKSNYSNLEEQELFENIKKQLLGKYDFRPKQIESIMHLLNGQNTCSIMGTGRGKSAIFQTVASYKALKEGKMTIIVYPLRALVNDQLAGMQQKLAPLGLKVMKGTGDMNAKDKEGMWLQLEEGGIDILLTTPEFIDYYKEKFETFSERIGFVVVDEGHHIGKATNAYRPAYKNLTEINERLGNPLFAVMTATCSDETFSVIKDILPIQKLVIDPAVRGNLTLIDKRELKQKEPYIADIISTGDKTIVYVNSREKTVEIAKNLRKRLPNMKDQIGYYHAGLSSENRFYIEKLFRDGKITTIVSTSAFGEGIDIPNIRHVIHYHMTFNEIEFNQESGRAGRDGEKAYVHLLFGGLDERINDFIMKKECPSKQMLRVFYSYLLQSSNQGQYEVALDLDDIARRLLPSLKEEVVVNNTVFSALNIFKELGFVDFMDSADIYYVKFRPSQGRVELNNSIRYQESLQELEEYLEFAKWVLQSDSMTLLRSLNRPIYPVSITKEA